MDVASIVLARNHVYHVLVSGDFFFSGMCSSKSSFNSCWCSRTSQPLMANG